MKFKILPSIVLIITTVGCSSLTPNPFNNSTSQASPVRTSFFCTNDLKGIPTTYAQTPRGRVSIIKWVSEYFKNSGYDPQQRCQEVSSQFQKLYNEGKLNYLSVGRKNNQSIICGLSASNSACEQLFTLKPGENAGLILQQMREIATGKAGEPVLAAGVVDLNEFLKKSPIEP